MIPVMTNVDKSGRESLDVISLEFKDRVIYLIDEITSGSATETISQLHQLDKSRGEITLYINSPGGSLTAGLAIVDAIRLCRNSVSTVATGIAASTAAIILACGEPGKRFITENCDIMIKQPGGDSRGQASDILIYRDHIIDTRSKINRLLSAATGKCVEKIAADTERETWFTSSGAVQYGIADAVMAKNDI